MDTKGRIGIVAVLAVAICAVMAVKCWPTNGGNPSPGPAASRPSAPLPTLVDLGKGKCVQCKNMIPVLDGLARDYAGRLAVVKIDLTEEPDAAEAYRVGGARRGGGVSRAADPTADLRGR